MINSSFDGESLLLGRKTDYISVYTPSLLCSLPRSIARHDLGISEDSLPFTGFDIWTAYELSWLGIDGKPWVAMAQFQIPCNSAFIVESKSLKLYLNSFNQTKFKSYIEVVQTIESDLTVATKSPVMVDLHTLNNYRSEGFGAFFGECIDNIEITTDHYLPAPELLLTLEQPGPIREALHSHLLKTNCPVTGQPDWASVLIDYTGQPIDKAGLLKYIISYRNYGDFHEHCIERIFNDIMAHCKPARLTVYGRYTRRGGLDINPFRTNCGEKPDLIRLVRQ